MGMNHMVSRKWLVPLIYEGRNIWQLVEDEHQYTLRNALSDRMKGSNNGAARVIGFVDFREKRPRRGPTV